MALNINPGFWRDVLIAWSKVNCMANLRNTNKVLQQGLWLNSNIKVEGKPLQNNAAMNI